MFRKKNNTLKDIDKMIYEAYKQMKDSVTIDDYKKELGYKVSGDYHTVNLFAILKYSVMDYLITILISQNNDWFFKRTILKIANQFRDFVNDQNNYKIIGEFLNKIWESDDDTYTNSDTFN